MSQKMQTAAEHVAKYVKVDPETVFKVLDEALRQMRYAEPAVLEAFGLTVSDDMCDNPCEHQHFARLDGTEAWEI